MLIFTKAVVDAIKDQLMNNRGNTLRAQNIPFLAAICGALYRQRWDELIALIDADHTTATEDEIEFIALLIDIANHQNPMLSFHLLESDYGFYAIFLACKSQNADFLQQVKSRCPRWFQYRTHFSSTDKSVLMWASQIGHAWSINWLLTNIEVDVNQRDLKGYTPAMLAAYAGHVTILKMLAEAGADFQMRSFFGKRTVLLLAASNGQRTAVQWLLSTEGKASINEVDKSGANAYLLAAKYNSTDSHMDLIQFLRDTYGAKIDKHDNAGHHAASVALAAGQYPMACWLLSMEAKENNPRHAHFRIPFDLCYIVPPHIKLPSKVKVASDLYCATQSCDWEAISELIKTLDSDYLKICGYEGKTLIQHLEELAAENPGVISDGILKLQEKAARKEFCIQQLLAPAHIDHSPQFFLVRHHTPGAEYLPTRVFRPGS